MVGLEDICEALDEIEHKSTDQDYHALIPTLMHSHNSTVGRGTGYTPNQLRINNPVLNLLDM